MVDGEEEENNNIDLDNLEDQEVDFKVSSIKKAFQLSSSPLPSQSSSSQSSSTFIEQNVFSTESKVEEASVDDHIKFKPNNNFKLPPIKSGNYHYI